MGLEILYFFIFLPSFLQFYYKLHIALCKFKAHCDDLIHIYGAMSTMIGFVKASITLHNYLFVCVGVWWAWVWVVVCGC